MNTFIIYLTIAMSVASATRTRIRKPRMALQQPYLSYEDGNLHTNPILEHLGLEPTETEDDYDDDMDQYFDSPVLDHLGIEVDPRKKCKKKKSKGKGKGKGKCKKPTPSPTSAPTISMVPSTTPTDSPSMSPSKSHQPSDTPSTLPSLSPSLSHLPSMVPTLTPSFSPSDRPSLTPSQHPSLKPTSTPSTSPTLKPSQHPSNVPSLYPSQHPSSLPTTHPSSIPTTNPSASPSISLLPSVTPTSTPSMNPSISHRPTIETIGGYKEIFDDIGNRGVQWGCYPPTPDDAERYAEQTVVRAVMNFFYSLNVAENITNEVIESDLMIVEEKINDLIYEGYVTCPGANEESSGDGNDRRLLDSDGATRTSSLLVQAQDLPGSGTARDLAALPPTIGVNTFTPDTVSTDESCSTDIDGAKCIVVEGGVTLLFESDADVVMNALQNDFLKFVRDMILNNPNITGTFSSNIMGVSFLGTNDGMGLSPGDTVIVAEVEEETKVAVEDDGEVSIAGAAMIGTIVLVVTAALAMLGMKLRDNRNTRKSLLYHSDGNRTVLGAAKYYDLKEYREDSLESEDDLDDILGPRSKEPTSVRKKGEEMIKLNDDPKAVYHIEFDPSTEEAPKTWMEAGSACDSLHDSHRCKSATCPICAEEASSKRVRFVSTIDDDGVEVFDGYGSVTSFSMSARGEGRQYESSDTIAL